MKHPSLNSKKRDLHVFVARDILCNCNERGKAGCTGKSLAHKLTNTLSRVTFFPGHIICNTSAVSKIYFFPALPSLARFSALSGLFWSFICTLSLKIGKKRAIFRKYGKEPKVVYFPLYELYSFLATLVCFQIMPTCTSVKTFKPPNSTLSY